MKKKLNSLDKYVIFSISVLLIYTVFEFYFTVFYGFERTTLTNCVYACFGGEILSCALIKIFKLRGDSHDTDDGDNVA